jgi:hypothetical protein
MNLVIICSGIVAGICGSIGCVLSHDYWSATTIFFLALSLVISRLQLAEY